MLCHGFSHKATWHLPVATHSVAAARRRRRAAAEHGVVSARDAAGPQAAAQGRRQGHGLAARDGRRREVAHARGLIATLVQIA